MSAGIKNISPYAYHIECVARREKIKDLRGMGTRKPPKGGFVLFAEKWFYGVLLVTNEIMLELERRGIKR